MNDITRIALWKSHWKNPKSKVKLLAGGQNIFDKIKSFPISIFDQKWAWQNNVYTDFWSAITTNFP